MQVSTDDSLASQSTRQYWCNVQTGHITIHVPLGQLQQLTNLIHLKVYQLATCNIHKGTDAPWLDAVANYS